MSRSSIPSVFLGAAALALTLACGGGGGGGGTTSTPPPSATKLVYTDPSAGAYQLKKNATLSTNTHLVLDLVGDGSTTGAGLAFSLSVDTTRVTGWTKVAAADAFLVENGTVLNLGAGTPIMKSTTAAAGGTQTLSAAVAQKGFAGSVALNGPLARVAVDLKNGAMPGSITLTVVKASVLNSAGTIASAAVTAGSLSAQ
ncbi:MAG TPA: hypothetical protein VJ483_05295 [Holophagaceae bacterium]|nr:hypothetical protein [Holophagaceae bacterium]